MIALLSLALLSARAVAADGFAVTLTFGKDLARAQESPGVESYMRMGVDPAAPVEPARPGQSGKLGEWTLRERVPEPWVTGAAERRVVAVSEYVSQAGDEVVALGDAVTTARWAAPGDDLATARRVVALLHVAAPNDERPFGPDYGIWRPWELIADPEHADTFSAALVSMLVLGRLHVDAQLALYVSGTTEAYGLVVPGVATVASPDVFLAAPGHTLVSCHRNAPPSEPPLAAWSRAQIVAPGWKPELPPNTARPPHPEVDPLPAVVNRPPSPETKWLVLTALVVVAGTSVVGFFALRAKRRRERVAARRANARKDSFS